MKKLVLLFAAAVMTVSASAAEKGLAQSKFTDNWYIGVQGGLATKTTHNKWFKNLNPNAGLRIGKLFTPVFGVAIEGNAYFSNKPYRGLINGTVVRAVNTNVLGTVNLANLFGGYQGTPRAFEVTALYGFGWLHTFGTQVDKVEAGVDDGVIYSERLGRRNRMTSKAALDFAFNFGSDKQFQIFIEPSMNWIFGGVYGKKLSAADTDLNYYTISSDQPSYNINNSFFQLNAGFVYKFNNSYGSHNFKLVDLRDQAEIDALNAQINELRNRKPEVIEKIVEKEAPVQQIKVEDLVFVTFAQGKSELTSDAKAALDNVKEGAHVQIVGTASPEGSKELNDRLSQARADVVADYLKNRGVNVDEAVGKGVQGTTSNRLAIVYVK